MTLKYSKSSRSFRFVGKSSSEGSSRCWLRYDVRVVQPAHPLQLLTQFGKTGNVPPC
jgi:hypothetical protein